MTSNDVMERVNEACKQCLDANKIARSIAVGTEAFAVLQSNLAAYYAQTPGFTPHLEVGGITIVARPMLYGAVILTATDGDLFIVPGGAD